ncbi:hypothetical protein CYPRO_0843 [Cyclonatronum proteinivorum]|uniref:Outer membrane protein beta-barrel domain-containing protein n=1 Tax=Cyclonatronum proteinivorum TaxID=1457365 RepID=A0A345UI18_9BACT|nr:hypothetical protein [Cyclonatronum proteinivorum]AXJ00120.1 hypothetical protein CYPRO_0843 [Cyclonatronum proteinivorum]
MNIRSTHSPKARTANRKKHSKKRWLKLQVLLLVMLLMAGTHTVYGQSPDDPVIPEGIGVQQESLTGLQIGLDIETGGFWFSRNDARIPGDTGTKFDLRDLTGTSPEPFIRLNLKLGFGDRHNVRLLFAPLAKTGTGQLSELVRFEDSEFAPSLPTEGTFRFNTYRATYRYDFFRNDRWEIGAGAAVLIRDAKIELTQGELNERNTDLGFVPLLHFRTSAFLTDRFTAVLDAEGLIAPQGRAFDVSLHADYRLSDAFSVFAGYRFLDGGADNDEVYSFAWINYLKAGLSFRI